MTFAKIDEVKLGDVLIADGGFTCLRENEKLTVSEMLDGTLFVKCGHGIHALDGQLNEEGEYVGFTKK